MNCHRLLDNACLNFWLQAILPSIVDSTC